MERRNVVLRQMLEQGYLTRSIYEQSIKQPAGPPEMQARASSGRRWMSVLHELVQQQ